MAGADTVGAWYRGRRLGAVDGTTLDVADTEGNDAFFGRPGSGRGEKKSTIVPASKTTPTKRKPKATA